MSGELPGRGAPLSAERVSFSYPDGTQALRDVNLSIKPGELVAIVGQNGSGKSTLVRHFNGLLRPTAGRVLLDGHDIAGRHVALLARDVGLSFQNPDRQIFSGRVRSEVGFGAHNVGLRGEELARAIASALDAVGLEGHAGTNPYDLGFSERKLLALASILAMRTRAIVLDEPTTGQDRHGVERVVAIVRSLAAEGRTVVAISHDMGFVARAFERVIVMRAGAVVIDAAVENAFAQSSWPVLESTFLEPPLPARLGAAAGLGSTPTEESFVSALAASRGRA